MRKITVTVLESMEDVINALKTEGADCLTLVIDDGVAHFTGSMSEKYSIQLIDNSESYDEWFHGFAEYLGVGLYLT